MPGQPVQGSLAGACHRAAAKDEGKAGVEPYVDPAKDGIRP